jgi:hypothetical protein
MFSVICGIQIFFKKMEVEGGLFGKRKETSRKGKGREERVMEGRI